MNEEERFWSKVDKSGDCWLWTGAIQNGYGIFTLSAPSSKNVRAHRYAYEKLVGAINETLDHLCRVRHCVNPEHLEDVSMGENNRRSTGHRVRHETCPKGHSYQEHGRLQDGYPVCRICDAERHRNARLRKEVPA